MLTAARFNRETYLELKGDKTATGQAVAAAFVACLSYSIGHAFLVEPLALDSILIGILAQLIISLGILLGWSITVFLIGTKLFKGKATFWEMARPFFFATSPFTLFILVGLPIHYVVDYVDLVDGLIVAVGAVWGVLTGLAALKSAMGFDYNRAMLTYIVGWLSIIAILSFV